MIPPPNTNDLSEPNNFRPISILSLLSKLIERHTHKHLINFLNEHNLLCQSQSGFCPQHSCHTALAKLCHNWLSCHQQLWDCWCCFSWPKKKELLILLISIFYLREYIQPTPHLSRYLNLIWSQDHRVFMLTVNTLTKELFVVEILKDLFYDLFYFVFLSVIFPCILLAIKLIGKYLRMILHWII